MNKVIKIEARRIPTIYPIDSYTDRMWTNRRVLKDDFYEEQVITEKKFSTIDDPFFDNQTIQVLLYHKYKLQVIVDDSVDVALIKYAQIVNITTQDGTIHKAKVLNISYEDIADLTIRKYTIEYADINRANYLDNKQPVNDFLKSDVMTDFYDEGSLNYLYFKANKSIGSEFPYSVEYSPGEPTTIDSKKIYTKLNAFIRETSIDEQTNDIQGIQEVSNSRSQSVISLRFYLNENDKFFVQKYASRCISEAGEAYIVAAGQRYNAIERTLIIVNETSVGIDCYQVDVEIKYKKIDFNVYS